jgi:hypothetical protein
MIRTVANKPRENLGAMQGPRYQTGPISAPQPQKSTMGMVTDMAKSTAIDKALTKGQELANPYIESGMSKLGSMFAPAKTGADAATLAQIGTGGASETALIGNALTKGAATTGATGAMAGLGAAVPYIGAGLLAGKALGFFNQGGPVEGNFLKGPLALRKLRYKQDGGKIEVEATMGE